MSKQPRTVKCGNNRCNATSTPLWRKGWRDVTTGKIVMLCNACGLHYKKGHFCSYCFGIYKESDADDTENPWIGCDRCSRWIHRECEKRHNEGRVHEIVIDQEERGLFLCPECRDVEQAAMSSGNAQVLQEFHESLQYSRRKRPGLDRTKRTKKKKQQQQQKSAPRQKKANTVTKSRNTNVNQDGVRKPSKMTRLSVSTTGFAPVSPASTDLSPVGSVVLESPMGSPPRSPFPATYYPAVPHRYQQHQQQHQQQHGYHSTQYGMANWNDYQHGQSHSHGYFHPQASSPVGSPIRDGHGQATYYQSVAPAHHHYVNTSRTGYRSFSPSIDISSPYYVSHGHFFDKERQEYEIQFQILKQRMAIRMDQERLSKKYRTKFTQIPAMTKFGTLWAVCDELFSSADFSS